MLSSHVMPDEKQAAFIWYHADAQLADVLQAWVASTGKALGIPSKLMVRHQTDKTTFMEIYESTGGLDMKAIVRAVEASAAKQTWFVQLHSPRRGEIFTKVQCLGNTFPISSDPNNFAPTNG